LRRPGRRVLAAAAAFAVVVLVIAAIQHRRGPDAKPLPGPSLKVAAGERYVGTAVDAVALDREPGYRKVLWQQFDAVTPENAMKWAVVEPEQGKTDWSGADALVDFARTHGQRVRGHALVWHVQYPEWIKDLPAAKLRTTVRRHIATEVGRYKGRVADWDVANEVVADDGSLRPSIFLNRLGPGYIARAFRDAHAADPAARLWINEIGAEPVGPKSDRLYALVRQLRGAGVPVDGVGFQGHFSLEGVPPTFRANLERFAALGVKVAITELDVALPVPASDDALRRQAGIYADAAGACHAVPACVGVTVWGFTDRHSWIPSNQPGSGAATLLDGELRAKPAFRAFGAALAGAPAAARR
jgi:endo-1,4-beta-xylanase